MFPPSLHFVITATLNSVPPSAVVGIVLIFVDPLPQGIFYSFARSRILLQPRCCLVDHPMHRAHLLIQRSVASPLYRALGHTGASDPAWWSPHEMVAGTQRFRSATTTSVRGEIGRKVVRQGIECNQHPLFRTATLAVPLDRFSRFSPRRYAL
jgi:hypothetical protein